MRYCAAAETGYEQLSGQSSDIFVPTIEYEEDGKTLAMLLPREDLANMSNMTTSNAIRTLSQFAQEGLLALDGKHIRILDEKALEKISRLG